MMSRIYFFLLLVISVNFIRPVQGQDLHLSQFDASPVTLNPAFAGMYPKGEFRAAAQFRSQWSSVADKFLTSSFAFDVPFKERWGLGGYILNNDAARQFNVFNFAAGASYNVIEPTNKNHMLSAGIQLGVIHKSIDIDEYLFDNQYQEGLFNTYIPSGENYERTSKFLPELNMGVMYKNIDTESKVRPHAGFALYHILRPKEGFVKAENSRLPIRWVGHGGVKFVFNDFSIDPRVLFMYQRNAMDLNFGFSGQYDLSDKNVNVIAGCFYRWNDAIIPMFGLEYFNTTFQLSYDINVSGLKEYTQGRGGVEFSLIFKGFTSTSKSGSGGFAHPRPY